MVITAGTIAFIILFGVGKVISANSHHIPHSKTTEILNVIAFFLFLAAGTELVGAGIGQWPVDAIHWAAALLPGDWGKAIAAVLVVAALFLIVRVARIATLREGTAGGGGGGMRGGGGGGVSGVAMRTAFLLPIVLAAAGVGALAVIWTYMQQYAGMVTSHVLTYL